MKAHELQTHKKNPKSLGKQPAFKPFKRGKLPRPFHRMGGPRVTTTGLLPVGDVYKSIFFVRDGATLHDTAFLGFLMLEIETQVLSPLFEFHWHPGHKGFHCKTPCRDDRDFTGRQLPGVRELNMTTQELDARVEAQRQILVEVFCRACGIKLAWLDQRQGKLGL